MLSARPYQSEAERCIDDAWRDGARAVLVVMPTGTGKTVLFSLVANGKLPGRTMVLAHRQELVWQAAAKMREVTGAVVEVEMGEMRASVDRGLFTPSASVIVSTIQTHTTGGDGGGRLTKFNPDDFDLLIIDEAHHATSASYRRVIDHYKQNPRLVILGVTATPDRGDEEALGQVFEAVAYDYEILDAINDGWLVQVEQQMVETEVDFSNVRTVAGDLSGADLARVMEAEKPMQGIASATIDIAGQRRGIGFAASVAHAKNIAEIFNRHRAGMAAFLHAKTDPDERKQILARFRGGDIQWVWNCGILTEGFDDDGVEVVAMGRPTESRALYAQMAGRPIRPHLSVVDRINHAPAAAVRRAIIRSSCKPSCLIIDFVGNSGKHKLMTTADILGGKYSDEVVAAAATLARSAGRPVRMAAALEEEEVKAKERERRKLESEARKARLVAKVKHTQRSIDPFDVLALEPVKPRGWDRGRQPSEKMCSMIRGAGMTPDGMDYAKAHQLCGVISERRQRSLCTVKQAAKLEKFGFAKKEAADMSFTNAGRMLDAIAANGWRRPAAMPSLLRKAPPRPGPAREPSDNDGGPALKKAPPRPDRVALLAGAGPLESDDVPF